jgi:ketosteroid isomerase-like protein
MSEENVSLVRDMYELLPDLRNPDSDTVARLFRDYADPWFELHLPPDYPEGEQVLRGWEGMESFAAGLRETWSEWGFVPERFLDADDRVLVFARLVAVGHESGVPVELETNHLWTVRKGRAISLCVYRDRAEALDALERRDQGASNS